MKELAAWPEQMGRQPLHYAAVEGKVDLAAALLTAGADPNAQDRAGFTPLHFAAQGDRLAVAELLLDRGARVDLEDRHGNQPLWTAVFNSRGDGSMIKLLRAHGADPTKPNTAGRTPLGLARLIANYPVAQWFADLPE